jgi:hypothetical protein
MGLIGGPDIPTRLKPTEYPGGAQSKSCDRVDQCSGTPLYPHWGKRQKEGITVQTLRFARDVLQIALVRQGHPHRNDSEHVDWEIDPVYDRRYCVVRCIAYQESCVANQLH